MAVWVKLKTIQHVEVQGKIKSYNPGDWVHVGRQTAERWIAQNWAWRPNGEITGKAERATDKRQSACRHKPLQAQASRLQFQHS